MREIDAVVAAFDTAGWTTDTCQSVAGNSRSPNPTRLDLVRGKRRLPLLAYAWRITGEGKGRSGSNYRVQATRSHKGDLLMEPERLTIGFGIDTERQVLAAFDGWTKRATGKSTSVHIQRATLDAASEHGYAEEEPPWDSRAAARFTESDRLMPWITRQQQTRTAAVQARSHSINDDTATVIADWWNSAPAAWLRAGDQLVLADSAGKHLLDTALWRVDSLDVKVINPEARYPRRNIIFTCRRAGRVKKNETALLHGLSGRS